MKAGFIGLGTLGMAIAQHLIDDGVELVVWNRTAEKAAGLDAQVAASPADLIARVPLAFVNVRDSAAVDEVLAGEQGLLDGDCAGRLIVDLTTNHFADVTRFHVLAQARGAAYLEAPVLGSVVPASKGALTMLVSGDQDAYDRAFPYLQKVAASIFFLEHPGFATRMKLINNLVLGVFNAALAEAVALAEVAGLDKAAVLDILEAGAGKSGILSAKKQKWLDEDFAPHFSTALIHKDLHYLQDLARELSRPAFTASAVKELYGLALAQDRGSEDFSVIYKVFKELGR